MTDNLAETVDISEGAPDQNKLRHLISLSLTKTADAFINPKLILTWLMTALGAPAYLSAAVVPIREAGALLPQPLVARWVTRYHKRKHFWALGAVLQGLAAALIVLIAMTTAGSLAGWLVLAALLVFVAGRSIASTTYKDALARTVDEGERGSVTGWAGTVSAIFGLAFGASMAFGIWGDVSVPVVAAAIALGAVGFFGAALVFVGLNEDPQTEKTKQPNSINAFLQPLREDRAFRRYVISRAFLTATALAPPFIVLASAGSQGSALTSLGPLVIASGMAAIMSSAIWGKLSDRSSRLSLAIGGTVAAIAYGAAVVAIVVSDGKLAPLLAAALLFLAQVGYQGVRSGRSIYLTDMASDDTRLRYTALSNILIGAVLTAGLGLAGVAQVFGPAIALGLCAGLSIVGALYAFNLKEASA